MVLCFACTIIQTSCLLSWQQLQQLQCYVHVVEKEKVVCVSRSYLVDLVHHPEGAAVELLQGHEVEHCGDAALSSTLMVSRQLVELSAAVKLHPNTDSIFVIFLLQWENSNHAFDLL